MFFCTTTLPSDSHVKFYDSFKQKKRLLAALKGIKLIYTVPQA